MLKYSKFLDLTGSNVYDARKMLALQAARQARFVLAEARLDHSGHYLDLHDSSSSFSSAVHTVSRLSPIIHKSMTQVSKGGKKASKHKPQHHVH